MRTIQSIYGIFLPFCFFSVLLADDDFSKFEEDMLSSPPGYGQTTDEVKIYSRISNKTTKKAIDTQFDSIQTTLVDMTLEEEPSEFNRYLKIDKDDIKVYLFAHKNSKLATFKAVTHIQTSLDSILAVLFDNTSCTEWIDSCGKAFILDNVSFSERYHYQRFNIPFPFIDRDFIFHSILTQNPRSKSINITMYSEPDYCNDKQSTQCHEVNQSKLVRVRKSIGTYKLEPDSKGIKITWIHHTDPGGYIPSWLVNQFAADTPYRTFKNLAEMVNREKYKYAKLIYNNEGIATALSMPEQKRSVQKMSVHLPEKEVVGKKLPVQKLTTIFDDME